MQCSQNQFRDSGEAGTEQNAEELATQPVLLPPDQSVSSDTDISTDVEPEESGIETNNDVVITSPDQVVEACQGQRTQVVLQVNFPERTDACDFGNDGNNNKQDKRFSARAVTTQQISIPQNALLCSFAIQSQATDLRYDDAFFFNVDNYLITGSHKTMVDLLDTHPVANLKLWNFEKVKGQEVDFGEDKLDYCTTNATCIIPPHDQTGPFNIKLETNEVAPLVIALNGKENIDLSIVTGGDDNDSDCTHSPFNLIANYSYVIHNSGETPVD